MSPSHVTNLFIYKREVQRPSWSLYLNARKFTLSFLRSFPSKFFSQLLLFVHLDNLLSAMFYNRVDFFVSIFFSRLKFSGLLFRRFLFGLSPSATTFFLLNIDWLAGSGRKGWEVSIMVRFKWEKLHPPICLGPENLRGKIKIWSFFF